ncbi:hypothetical protein HOD61_01575 [archaeon]|jgi:hypothetical protein|nr:hypothetical protein [archaeon]
MPAKKKANTKKTTAKSTKKITQKKDTKFDKLVENNLALQKISLNLINSNNELVKRLDNLVGLFEEASKNVGKVDLSDKSIGKLTSKVEELVDENKDLAKGLVLLERYVRGKSGYQPASIERKPMPGLNPRPLPKI